MIKHTIFVILTLVLLQGCGKRKNTRPIPESSKTNQEKLVDANRILVKRDKQKIKGHIDRQGWNMKESGTGLWYEILYAAMGDSIKTDMLISFDYNITLLDGTLLYSSNNDGKKKFVAGKGDVVSGLQQGILLLTEGSSARFILPPHLAHGLTGDGERIPARAILVYSVENIRILEH